MEYVPILVAAIVGLLTSLAAIPVIIARMSAGAAKAQCSFHHTHRQPMPRLGGVALAAAFAVVGLLALLLYPLDPAQAKLHWVIYGTSLAMFGLGLWDDLKPLGARKKLLGQVVISGVACAFGLQIGNVTGVFGGSYQLFWIGPVLSVLWLVGLTNLINLIDGIDGLAGGIALMLMALLVYVGNSWQLGFPLLAAAAMVGALVGFLRFNFPPAKIYMGDGGAYFLGFLIGALSLINSHKGSVMAALLAPLFALALPVLDVTLAIVRRALKGLPLFRADRGHLHHKLVNSGLTRTRAVLVLYGISVVFLLMAFGVFWSQGRWVPIFFGFACLILLLAARSFSFSRNWFSVGRVLGNSLDMRREIQYGLALSHWLELEAQRVPSLEQLWDEYTFVIRKLGLTQVRLKLNGLERTWKRDDQPAADKRRECSYHLAGGGTVQVTVEAHADEMTQQLFEHMAELAAEAWAKSSTRWCVETGQAAQFTAKASDSVESATTASPDPQPAPTTS
ncbi:MAG: undecaprenyl/decaprenyl-phosphate alpha-N-acetylglucosaminyl 1-phosphate transferase [Verrucomicrobia bacterium]|nr:undecaprenyl/decaprenyl-phosphate alpha-N-acetylglucosaminyl 1-phosphate transferase [Verrucomicrobiota bacterium]